MTIRWHVVNTFSGAEWHAAKRLRETPWRNNAGDMVPRCTEVWWPKYDASARRGRWELCRGVSHFPGYVFCALSPGQHAEHLKVSGVQAIVSFDGRYVIVPQEIIDALKRRVSEAGDAPLDRTHEPINPYAPGQNVVIIDGPFKGFIGQIASIDKADEIKIWVGLFGQTVPVDNVPVAAVSPVPRCA